MTPSENDRLTRVTGDAPMGRLMRENCWLPFARSEAVAAGAAPMRVRLLGKNLVAFRGQDGSLGLVDEHCPHRGTSLALARVEGCSLRCVYHGWRIDRTGEVVEVPSEGANSARFAARIETSRYSIAEGGGLVWAYLGEGDPPQLPPLPFMDVAPEGRWWSRTVVACNWLQGFEGALDSVHIGWLHKGWSETDKLGLSTKDAPVYEIEETGYGLRTAAVRAGADSVHFRVAEFISPFFAFAASRQPLIPTDCSCFISVPIDDEAHLLFFGMWDETGRLEDFSEFFADLDPDNLVTGHFDAENSWGQDRLAMEKGHFSGFTGSVLHEDVGVQMSMGPIVDRSRENLCGTDLAVVRMRQFLLKQLAMLEAGNPVDRELSAYAKGGHLPFSHEAPLGSDWRESGKRSSREESSNRVTA